MLGWGLCLLGSGSWAAGGHKGQGLWLWLALMVPGHAPASHQVPAGTARGVLGPNDHSAAWALGTKNFALKMWRRASRTRALLPLFPGQSALGLHPLPQDE